MKQIEQEDLERINTYLYLTLEELREPSIQYYVAFLRKFPLLNTPIPKFVVCDVFGLSPRHAARLYPVMEAMGIIQAWNNRTVVFREKYMEGDRKHDIVLFVSGVHPSKGDWQHHCYADDNEIKDTRPISSDG